MSEEGDRAQHRASPSLPLALGMDSQQKDGQGRAWGEPKAVFKKKGVSLSNVVLKNLDDTSRDETLKESGDDGKVLVFDGKCKGDSQKTLKIRQIKPKQQEQQEQQQKAVLSFGKKDVLDNDYFIQTEKGLYNTEYYCDIRLLKQLLKFFIGIISIFKKKPALKFKFDEFGFIKIKDVEDYLEVQSGLLLPSLKNSTKPFYEIQDDEKVRFDYQLFLENFCPQYSPSSFSYLFNHNNGNNNISREKENIQEKTYYAIVELKNICSLYCGFGACSLYIVQKGTTVYTSMEKPLPNSDKVVIPFKLRPIYEESYFPLCNYLFDKYKHTKSITIHQNRPNLEVAFIPRTFIEWENTSLNILPIVSPNLVSIDRYFVGGNENEGYFILVVDRISGKTEVFKFSPGHIDDLMAKLVEYIPNYSSLREYVENISFHSSNSAKKIKISPVDSKDDNSEKENENEKRATSEIKLTIKTEIVHDESNNNKDEQQQQHKEKQKEDTDKNIKTDDEPKVLSSNNSQKELTKNKYGFVPALNSNSFPLCIVGNISEIVSLSEHLKEIVTDPNIIILTTTTTQNTNEKKLEYVTEHLEHSKKETLVSHGYYQSREETIVITLNAESCCKFKKNIDDDFHEFKSKSSHNIKLIYKPTKVKSLKLTDVSVFEKMEHINNNYYNENNDEKIIGHEKEKENKSLKLGKSDFYILSWNVLLQYFNVVSNYTQVMKAMDTTELHPNYNNNIYSLKVQNIINIIRGYAPDIICLQEADETISNNINKIVYGADEMVEKHLLESENNTISSSEKSNDNISILQETCNPYTSILCDRYLSTGLRTGVLTAFNSKKYRRLFTITIPFNNLIGTDVSKKYFSGKYKCDDNGIHTTEMEKSELSPDINSFSYPYNRQSSALIVALENIKTQKCIVVLNVHTYWNPSFEGVRVLEGINCLENLKIAIERVKKHINSRENTTATTTTTSKSSTDNNTIAVLLVGDLNDKPSNELYSLISKGFTDYRVGIDPEENDSDENIKIHDLRENEDESKDHHSVMTSEKLHTYSHNINLTSSLSILPSPENPNPTNLLGPHDFVGEPYSTTKTPTFEATIDYIFHNKSVEVKEVIVDNLTEFIPSGDTPSDHRVGVVGLSWGRGGMPDKSG